MCGCGVCVCVGGDLLASNIHGYRAYFHWEMVTVMKRVMVVYSMYSKHIYGIHTCIHAALDIC